MTTLLPHKFGPYGGQFVPETLMPALIELEEAFVSARQDAEFTREFDQLMASFVGRPTPLTHARVNRRTCPCTCCASGALPVSTSTSASSAVSAGKAGAEGAGVSPDAGLSASQPTMPQARTRRSARTPRA